MGDMTIAMMATSMAQQNLSEQMGVGVMKMAMNAETQAVSDMLDMIDTSNLTGVGSMVNLLA